MSEFIIEESIVSVDWLQANLGASNLMVLDATISIVTQTDISDSEEEQIPNSFFFDIKKKFSDANGQFPNTSPSEKQFTKAAQELGVSERTAIVIYDSKGIYSSARAWWLFKTFGHHNVAVLNGGMPEWKRKGFPLEKKQNHKIENKGNFVANYQKGYLLFYEDIKSIENDPKYTILDARSENRFKGLVQEPRKGLRSGRIPNSLNLPFDNLLQNGNLLPKDALKSIFENTTQNKESLVFSCGSGITACVLALGADVIGLKNIAVYDGSWTEYGSLINNDKTMHWTKEELVAYTLLYAANSNFIEDNKERNVIIGRVDMQTFQKVHDEFDADNDYQSLQKIEQGLKEHNYTQNDIDELLVDIKLMFFADGEFDVLERMMYRSLKNLLE